MVSLSHFLAVLLCTPLFLFFLHRRRRSRAPTSQKRLPPSPWKLPVVGNLHQLGSLPYRSLQSLSRRYGPLMLLHFGSVPVLVATSAEAAREIMKQQDLCFSNRPKLSIPGRLLYNHRDVAFSPHGEYWRRVRSICVVKLLSYSRVQSFRAVREEETSLVVEKIMGSASRAVNLSEVLMGLTSDVICRVALGKKYSDNGEAGSLKKMMDEMAQLLGIAPLWEYISFLEWTRRFDGVDERIQRLSRTFDEFLEGVIQEHRVRHEVEDDSDSEEKDGDCWDFVDILLRFQRDESMSSSPVEDHAIKAVILDIFMAGTDTTATAIEWAMSELIRNPKAMKTLQNEVRNVAQNKTQIEEEDLVNMPYLNAVMKESLRLHSPVPLLVPRESTRDTKVLGYDIAAGTRVFINAWAIARDPSLWENPLQFQPERFLDNGIDYRGLHFELIPFGAGRRGCPGITFAAALGEFALAKLVHKFDFGLANGVKMEELDMNESNGVTVHRKFPLLVVATPHA